MRSWRGPLHAKPSRGPTYSAQHRQWFFFSCFVTPGVNCNGLIGERWFEWNTDHSITHQKVPVPIQYLQPTDQLSR